MNICAIDDCDKNTSGKSKYCTTHRIEARERFVKMIDEQQNERNARNEKFAEVFRNAHVAGFRAAQNCVPEPMIVVQHENPWDSSSAITKVYEPVMDGVCGFAWINIKPGNSQFANWLKKSAEAGTIHLNVHKSYYGGIDLWVGDFGQSYERKRAYANAFAKVIVDELGVKAHSMGRLD